MTPKQIKQVLEKYAKWLRGIKGGERASLRGADLRGANLYRADLYEADLYGAKLYRANLCEADLRGANLYEADLRQANLQGANLRGANLQGANLYGASFHEASLQEASLQGADLLCFGNMREIRTMQIDTWGIGYTADTLQIGCKRHPIYKWRNAGREWIEQMDSKAPEWADRNLSLVLQIIDANPAVPTGHEKA